MRSIWTRYDQLNYFPSVLTTLEKEFNYLNNVVIQKKLI